MAATVPTTVDDFRGSGADMRFLMLEESSVLFKSNCFLLFSMESLSVWFVYLHTQTHNDPFNLFFAALSVILFSDDVKMVTRATVGGCSSDVASFLIVEVFIVIYYVLVVLCLVEEVCSCVVDSCS